MRKLTTIEVQRSFDQKGWKLQDNYEKSSKPMSVICPVGHNTKISWNNFQKGQGCKYCACNVNFTYDEVKQFFFDQGCELLETKYDNNGVLLNYKCSCGESSKIRFRDFKNGRRCMKCKNAKISQSLTLDESDVKSKVESYGVKYVSSWLKWCGDRNRTRITYVCKCNRTTDAWLSNFYKVQNCKECGNAKKSGSNCYMYDPDREAVEMRKKFRKMCGQHIKRFMEATGQKKTKHTHELLGYYPKDLQEHILNHPNYKNCIGKEWHVDHVFPIQAFIDHGILDLKIINRLDNLRPILGPDNLQKADKYDEKEFMEWLESHMNTGLKTY
jgi:hypothetical protein